MSAAGDAAGPVGRMVFMTESTYQNLSPTLRKRITDEGLSWKLDRETVESLRGLAAWLLGGPRGNHGG